jgi:hypothetical protein
MPRFVRLFGALLMAAVTITTSAAEGRAKSVAARNLLRCDVTYTSSFSSPWLMAAKSRTLDIDLVGRRITDKTVNGVYHQFDIVKNDSSWVVATSSRPSLIKEYLQFEDRHRPKYAEISVNKIDLSIQLIINTEAHVDDNDEYGSNNHIGSVVYDGHCNVVRSRI